MSDRLSDERLAEIRDSVLLDDALGGPGGRITNARLLLREVDALKQESVAFLTIRNEVALDLGVIPGDPAQAAAAVLAHIERLIVAEDDAVAALVSGRAQTLALERELRLEWWLNHGHDYFALYGDDGEMACNACPADFLRQPLDDLRTLTMARRAERAALAASPEPPPSGCACPAGSYNRGNVHEAYCPLSSPPSEPGIRLTAAEAEQVEARRCFESIIARCENGDTATDWLPIIARIARQGIRLLAGPSEGETAT